MKKQKPKQRLEGKVRDKVQEPSVLINDYRETAILLWTARQYSYLCKYDNGIRIVKLRNDSVKLKEFRELHYYVDGKQGPVCYKPEDAARRFLQWGNHSGITEAASRILEDILKGSKDMSNVETATEKQGDTKIPAAGDLASALIKATGADKPKTAKKASTKNGTTASVKRPSKAKTVDEGPTPGPTPTNGAKPAATKKGAAVKKEAPKAAAKKEAPKTKAKAAKKTPAKKEAPKTKAAKKENGRPTTLDVEKTIKVLAEENPRREGSKGYMNWSVIKRYNGKKVGAYLDAGGRADNLRKDISRGNVKLV